jgi:hypothetical protein
LAAAVGLLAQAPARSAAPVRDANAGCPTGIDGLLGMVGSRTASTTVTCDSRNGKDVAAHVLVRDAAPLLGESCEDLRLYNVTLVETPEGWAASFAFAGGATRGIVRLHPDQTPMIGSEDAYVADTQLGSYEPTERGGDPKALACRLDPTYHFFCPASGVLDRLCVTWVYRPSRSSTGR